MASDAVVNLVVDATRTEGEVTVQLRRIVNDAERGAPPIDLRVQIDNASVVRAVNRVDQAVNDMSDRMNETLRDGFGDLSTILGNQTDLLGDHLQDLSNQLNSLNTQLATVGDTSDDTFGDLDRHVQQTDDDSNRLSDTFRRIAGTAGGVLSVATSMGSIGVAAGAAVPLVAGLVASIVNIVPAAAAGATAFLALKAATLTLKLGLTGVADAIKTVFDPNATPDALEKSLKNLSPNAREFVGVLQEMKPAFDDLRLEVQDRLFSDLDKTLQTVGKTALPAARSAALDFSDTFNQMGKNVGGAAGILSKEGTLGSALKSGTEAFGELEKVPGQVVLAIGRLAAAGGPLLNRLADSISGVVDGLSTGLADASRSGALEDAVNTAGDAIAQLGDIAGNVFGALGNILGAAGDQGDGLFGSLEAITQQLQDVTATKGFQDSLTGLMDVSSTLADNVLPLVAEAFRILGPVIQTLAPPVQRIIDTLGVALLDILKQLEPSFTLLADSVGILLDALNPLIPVFADMVSALLPALPPLFQALNDIIVSLSPVIAVMAQTLSDTMVPAITDLVPVIVQLAEFFAQLVAEITPLAVEVLPILLPLLNGFLLAGIQILAVLTPLIGATLDAGIAITDALITPFELLIPPVLDAIDTLQGAATVLNGPVQSAVQIIGSLLRGDFSAAWNAASINVGSSSLSMSEVVRSMASRITGYVSGLASDIISSFTRAFTGAYQAVVTQLGRALDAVRGWGSQALGAVSGFVGEFRASGAALIGGFIDGILSQIGRVRDAASSVVGAARDFFPFSPAKKGPFSGRGWTRYSGQALIQDFQAGVNDKLRGFAINWDLAGADPLIPALSGSAGVTNDPGGVSSLFGTSFARVTPAVNVYLGNELLTERVQVQIDESTAARDRQTSQGVRF